MAVDELVLQMDQSFRSTIDDDTRRWVPIRTERRRLVPQSRQSVNFVGSMVPIVYHSFVMILDTLYSRHRMIQYDSM